MTYIENLSDEQQALIKKHLELVIEANKTTNLTRIQSVEEAMVLHVEDSLAGLSMIENAPEGPYADIGSGAGYPGVPLAIASGRQTLLVDARQKKMLVMEGIISQLGLSHQVRTYAGRAELLARSEPAAFTAITARALAKLPVLLELASPLLAKDGLLVCYKAHVEESELSDASRVSKLVGMKLVDDKAFMLGEYDRRLLTFQKAGKPKVKLPRQEGQAQKNPL